MISAVLTVLILSCTFTAEASEKTVKTASEAFYGSVKLSDHDTWDNLAERFNDDSVQDNADYIREMKHINNIEGTNLHPGCYLTVKYYGDK